MPGGKAHDSRDPEVLNGRKHLSTFRVSVWELQVREGEGGGARMETGSKPGANGHTLCSLRTPLPHLWDEQNQNPVRVSGYNHVLCPRHRRIRLAAGT